MPSRENLTGSLLVAHPTLRDPNFRRTIIFLSQHSEDEGATGFILNRPLDDSMAEAGDLENVPVHFGGPVDPTRLVLTSLQWRENPTAVAFRMFVGSGGEEAIDGEWRDGLRAFAGYSGWSAGQLEGEIAGDSWIVIPPTQDLIEMQNPAPAWRNLMRHSGPLMHLLAEAPDEPGKN
ncbi:MAG: YqgE/AlgH family protein [Terrimicrobiaceae bacterium]